MRLTTGKGVDERDQVDHDLVETHTLSTGVGTETFNRVEGLKRGVCERIHNVEAAALSLGELLLSNEFGPTRNTRREHPEQVSCWDSPHSLRTVPADRS